MGGHAGSDLFRRLFPFRWVPNAGQWRRQPIEHTDDYCLAVVEFDDQGWFLDFHQRDALQRFLNEKANQNKDLFIVVFIHGWQHNAEPDDTSLKMFRSLLSAVCLSERHRHKRQVLGVYLSWRGLSLSGAWMLASFWTRKKAATRVALGCVREILARLRAFQTIRNQSNDVEGPDVGTRLIVAGHSFGGLILFTAVSEYLIESVILCQCSSEKHIVRPFGDLIILINPAFEAARYLPLYSVVLQADYPKNQRPCFLTVTSTNDDATGNWFPIGRWFDTRLESVRRNALPWGPPNAQGEAILNTMGHLQWLITHKLSCPKTQESAHRLNWDEEEKDFNKFNQRFRADGYLQKNWKRTYSSGAVLEHVCGDPDNPFWTIEATPEVVNGHSDIYRPVFLDFLRQVCDDRLRPIAC